MTLPKKIQRIGVRLYHAENPGRLVATIGVHDSEMQIADRMAALWNSCDGIPTEMIEREEFRSALLSTSLQIDNADRRERLGDEYRVGFDGPPAN